MTTPPVTTPRVLLLDPTGPESAAVVRTAAARGIEVHAVIPDTAAGDVPGPLATALRADLTHPQRALHEILQHARRAGVHGALTTNEYLTPLLAQVCAALHLPGNDPDLAPAARNKATMHQAFARHQVTTPRTLLLDPDQEPRPAEVLARLGLPCVVKPVAAAGAAGVTVVQDAAGLAGAWREVRDTQYPHEVTRDSRVLIQELVDGVEYSVESLTRDGRTVHLCTTRKTLTAGARRVEIGHSLPVELEPRVERDLHLQVGRALAALGIRNGASHAEAILTPAGRWVVLEVGARLGAGRIGFLIQHALGIDPWAALLDIALDRPAQVTPIRRDHTTIRFLVSPTAGRLRSIRGLPAIGDGVLDAHARARPGDLVDRADANRGRLGHFVLAGPEPEAVAARAEQILAGIVIDVEPCTLRRPAAAATTT